MASTTTNQSIESQEFALVIHGGAGTILKKNMSPEKEQAYREKLTEALEAGYSILEKGGSAGDAVVAAITIMEDSPLFNAGKGAVFTNAGTNEMDASFMDGERLEAGAVGGVRNVKNPILAARAVMEKSEHVMLSGLGAQEFAASQGIEMVDTSYFYTERRWKSLQRVIEKESKGKKVEQAEKHGTVGAVALDQSGNIVAGTSTGGMTNKRWGRLGDSPIIGAGTYANSKTCGVSATGHGEFFIRYAVAHDIHARMAYKNIPLQQAAAEVINEELVKAGGTGGVVALDKDGNIAMPFNTAGMYRGFILPDGRAQVFIYKDEGQ
ncbi:MAG: isoaspartyl peptidase/L-asparaginase [Bacteroidota bacterium]